MSKLSACLILFALAGCMDGAADQFSETHPKCGTISGASTDDISHLRRFCSELFQGDGPGAESAEANGAALTLIVSQENALATRQAPTELVEIFTKQLTLTAWKMATGYDAVTLRVNDGEETILTGTSTPSGDEVTVFP